MKEEELREEDEAEKQKNKNHEKKTEIISYHLLRCLF